MESTFITLSKEELDIYLGYFKHYLADPKYIDIESKDIIDIEGCPEIFKWLRSIKDVIISNILFQEFAYSIGHAMLNRGVPQGIALCFMYGMACGMFLGRPDLLPVIEDQESKPDGQ